MDAAICILFSPDRKAVCLTKRRDIPVWVLPGGGIEQGESPETAAVREMEEETGYRVEIVRKVGEYTPVNRLASPTHFFEVKVIGGSPKTGNETKEIHFFELEALPKWIPPPHRYWIQDAAADFPYVLKKKIEGTSYWLLFKLLIVHPILIFRFLLTKVGIHINSR